MDTRLPSPSVVVLVGASSSGKSTWAGSHFASNEIISSDELRALVGIDRNDLRASDAAFRLLDLAVAERIKRGLTTVIDTLGHDASRRSDWIALARSQDLPVFAVVFSTPIEICLNRNGERQRPLPMGVVRKQAKKTTEVVELLPNEGFDGIIEQQPVVTVPASLATGDDGQDSRVADHTFGLMLSRFDWGDLDLSKTLTSVAQRAEAAGFRDLWLMDHFRQIPQLGRPWEDIPEVYTTLSYLAAHTKTVRLGALVTGITHRNPAILGKMIATLDVLSGGRAIAGLGIAWDQEEHEAYGIRFPPASERYEMLEEAIEVLRMIWGRGTPEFAGKHFSAASLASYPRPVQSRIPILIGGSGEKKTLRLVAQYGDAANVFGNPERVAHKVEVLRGHCAAVGRDLDEIEVTHLTNAMSDANPARLRNRIGAIRPRDMPYETFADRYNAAPPDDLIRLFTRYHQAGSSHSIIAVPDVHVEGSLEAFAPIISKMAGSDTR